MRLQTEILGLSIAYVLLAALLLVVVLRVRAPWPAKVAAVLVTSIFYCVTFFRIEGLPGWSAAAPLPPQFQLLWARVVDPNPLDRDPGAVHVWIEELDAANIPNGQPRAYRLPYSPTLAAKVEAARDEIMKGHPQGGRRIMAPAMDRRRRKGRPMSRSFVRPRRPVAIRPAAVRSIWRFSPANPATSNSRRCPFRFFHRRTPPERYATVGSIRLHAANEFSSPLWPLSHWWLWAVPQRRAGAGLRETGAAVAGSGWRRESRYCLVRTGIATAAESREARDETVVSRICRCTTDRRCSGSICSGHPAWKGQAERSNPSCQRYFAHRQGTPRPEVDGRAADRQLQGTVGQARHQAKAQRLPACSDGIIQTAHRRRRSARKHHTELEFLERSSADVAEHVSIATGESDAVAGRIRFVPFELVVRNLYFRADFDMRTVSRAVGPIGINFAAA